MADGQVEGNSATAVAEPVSTGQTAPASTGTPSQSGQASSQAQSAPAEERFSNIDPETLAPELKAIYKNLQSDYTKKTQNQADLKKKADYFDQVSSRPDFNEWWKGISRKEKTEFKEQKAEVEKKIGEIITDEEFSQSLQSKEGFLALQQKVARMELDKANKKIGELEANQTVAKAADAVETFATQVDKDGKQLRPDFYSLDEDQLITGYLTINQPDGNSETAWMAKLNEAYNFAKSITQKYYEKGKQEAIARMQQKAATSTEPPTPPAKGAYTGPNPKNLSVKEAMELAKKGIRVPRDD